MRIKRGILASAVAFVSLSLWVVPAAGQGAKDDAPGVTTKADQQLLAAETAAARATTNPVVTTALGTLQATIARFVAANGTANSFGSYVDPATGRIVLETDAAPGLVATLVGGLGGLVEVRPATITDSFSRKADSSPFWGGSGVKSGTAICSSGFVVKKSTGARFLTEAGHCFANGATVRTESGNVVVGTVSQRGLPNFDMELIGGKSYSPRIFLGGVNSSSSGPVVGAADPVVNFTGYCHSGRTTGERCGHKVLSVTAQVCTSSGCKSPVIAYNGGTLPQGGDSGSPFFLKSGSNIHVRGMHIAGGGGTAYAEKWSRISSRLGVSIVV